MESRETTEDERTGTSGGAPDEVRPSPRLRSTKGGVGAAAGTTPKKSGRPSRSARPRAAGKKPDHGPG